MSKNHQASERDVYGQDCDNRLIKLVRANPAIYDVRHPNYRRNPIRIQIWDNIAKELGAPSRFLQTKWKNIRYNYLHELKNFSPNSTSTNARRRRYTEDLSFLKYTAQAYVARRDGNAASNSTNATAVQKLHSSSSDNDSNSYMYAEPSVGTGFEVIEIEPSDDDEESSYANEVTSKFRVPTNGNCVNSSSPNETTGTMPSSTHHNLYEPSGGTGPEVTTTNDLENSNWYEEKMDECRSLPPAPEVTIEQCRSGNNNSNNNKMSNIDGVLSSINNSNHHHHQQQQYSNSTSLSLHMTPGCNSGRDSNNSSNIMEMGFTNGGSGNVKDLINAEVTIEPIANINRHENHRGAGGSGSHQHFHHQSSQRSTSTPIVDSVVGGAEGRKLIQSSEMQPALAPINDPIELYCLSLVDCLRAMPRSERERVKFEFAKILKDAIYKDEA